MSSCIGGCWINSCTLRGCWINFALGVCWINSCALGAAVGSILVHWGLLDQFLCIGELLDQLCTGGCWINMHLRAVWSIVQWGTVGSIVQWGAVGTIMHWGAVESLANQFWMLDQSYTWGWWVVVVLLHQSCIEGMLDKPFTGPWVNNESYICVG